mmetsp:Transcript_27146/g.46650  ORF Transcript_27146/g.46650 Transcript_27146/m.46650 type:complete len:106 (-) Transcript_27146:19-336(-)
MLSAVKKPSASGDSVHTTKINMKQICFSSLYQENGGETNSKHYLIKLEISASDKKFSSVHWQTNMKQLLAAEEVLQSSGTDLILGPLLPLLVRGHEHSVAFLDIS